MLNNKNFPTVPGKDNSSTTRCRLRRDGPVSGCTGIPGNPWALLGSAWKDRPTLYLPCSRYRVGGHVRPGPRPHGHPHHSDPDTGSTRLPMGAYDIPSGPSTTPLSTGAGFMGVHRVAAALARFPNLPARIRPGPPQAGFKRPVSGPRTDVW